MNAKSSVFYPAVIFASVLGVIGILVLVGLQYTVTIEQTGSEPTLLPEQSEPPQSQAGASVPAGLSSSTVPTPKAKPLQSVKQEALTEMKTQSPVETAAAPGALRVSNQTDRPLRVALLTKEAANSSASKPNYEEPVHWDFAPGEGSSQGLILSLPQGDLKLKKGDIVVAFAQDGSCRYWGPYIVGETAAPVWDQKHLNGN